MGTGHFTQVTVFYLFLCLFSWLKPRSTQLMFAPPHMFRHPFHPLHIHVKKKICAKVVWKSTTHVGMGVGKSKHGTFVVAHYEPPGNYIGQFEEEVPQLIE